jgi:hypothetical protein
MSISLRPAARVSAVLLLIAGIVAGPGAVAASAAPARADLSVSVSGTAIPNGVTSQVATVTVTNHGPATAKRIRFRLTGWVDGESVDGGTVAFCPGESSPPSPPVPPIPPGDRLVAIGEECDLPKLRPGRSLTLDSTVVPFGFAIGTVGEFTVSVASARTDPAPGNNSVTSQLTRIAGLETTSAGPG